MPTGPSSPDSPPAAAHPAPLPDPRNAELLIWVGDRLWPRAEAKVSVFDSAVQGGDAVWEGLRVYDGRVFALDEHLERLERSARALAFASVPPRASIMDALFQTLAAMRCWRPTACATARTCA